MQIRQPAQGFGQIRSLPWIHHWRRPLPSCWPSSFCELSELGLRVANGQALTTSHPRMRPAGLESARRSGGRYALRCHDWIGQCLLSGDGALWPDPLEPSGADVCHQPTYPDRRGNRPRRDRVAGAGWDRPDASPSIRSRSTRHSCRGLERPRSPSDRPTTSDQASSIAQLSEMWPVQHRGCSSNDRSCQCRTVVRVGHDNDALSRRGKDQHITLIADVLATLHQHE